MLNGVAAGEWGRLGRWQGRFYTKEVTFDLEVLERATDLGRQRREGRQSRQREQLKQRHQNVPTYSAAGGQQTSYIWRIIVLVVGGHGDKGARGAIRLHRQEGSGWLCRGQWRALRHL